MLHRVNSVSSWPLELLACRPPRCKQYFLAALTSELIGPHLRYAGMCQPLIAVAFPRSRQFRGSWASLAPTRCGVDIARLTSTPGHCLQLWLG